MKMLAGLILGTVLGGVALGQSTGVASNEATVTDLAAALSERPMTFADLQRMKRIDDPQVSPSGKWVMFAATDVDLAANTKVSHLWVVPLKGGHVTASPSSEKQVTFWKEGETEGRFSRDGKQVAFVATDGTTGHSQIFVASWDEATGTLGTPKRLTNVSTEADGPVWSPDSQRILFVSRVYPECSDEESWLEEDACDKRKDDAAAASPVKATIFTHLLYRHWDHYIGDKRSHVLVVSVTDGNTVRDLTPRREIGDAEAPVFSLGGPVDYAWAPDSKEIAYVTNLDPVPATSTNNDVITLRLDDPDARAVKISTSPGSDDAPAYSPDGKYIAFRSQARAGFESDRFRLMLFDRQSKAITEMLPKLDNWVDEFTWAPNSKTIYFASGEMGEENILSTQVGLPEATAVANKAEYGGLQISPNGRALIAMVQTVRHPAEVASIALNAAGGGGAPVVRLTHLNDALLRQLDLPKMESFIFPGAGNTSVQGFIIRPPNFDAAKKYPLKFLMHGGPQTAWGDAWSYRWNAELFAADGYVVVMINRRGSTGYGQKFVDEVSGDWGGKAYVDLMKGLDYAEKQYPFIDKTRECALGASYGGYMADWVLTHTDRFKCIVTHDGMYNPQSAYGTTEELWFNEWEFKRPGTTGPGQPWKYAAGPVAEDPFRKWSPMLSIENAKTPTLIIHSQKDYRLDVSEGFQLFTALQQLHVPSKMLYFPDEGHWVLKPQNSELWYKTVNDWCDQWTHSGTYSVANTL
ncbi:MULTISPECIES: S9 family peptidase [Acidobacteriaceae]|uniref:dipeptidyl-peptidase 5 n=1 Tax=Acidobacteriaceae TaxID=204434 RepID=UPI00131D351E|nr:MULTISPECIES: S9 family peptidase [Acidobacteriaceae]MDW5264861.1 S9 family peptidase [Edaphobacter sp.]